MLALACLKFKKAPHEIRDLPRSEQAFMFAAMIWENEEEHKANKS